MRKCAVIGGGIGGLSAALYLARAGVEVDLFEQQQSAGGKALEHRAGGFRFDGGPTILTMPFVIDMLADENGIDDSEKPEILPLDETCRYFYPDGTVFHAYTDRPRFFEQIKKHMMDSPSSMAEYLSYSKRIYDLCAELFIFSSFHELDVLLSYRNKMNPMQLLEIDPFRKMHRANRSFFRDPRLVQFADRYATYNGSNPYRVPATLNIIHHVEQLGASVPAGGIAALPAFLEKAAVSAGARIHRGVEITGIGVKRSEVAYISTGGEKIPYRNVLSNVDVSATYRRLLNGGPSLDSMKYRMLEPSMSALVFYWGMKISQDRLAVHNILFSENYRKEFRDLFGRKRFPASPTVYIYISSYYNSSDAPEGYQNWYVMVNAPYITGRDLEAGIEEVRKAVVRRIREALDINVDEHIVCEDLLTPRDILERTGSHRGSLYGISSNSMMSAFFRQGNRSRAFRGLYFCGGSAHPGGGIPLTMLSGRTAAGIMLKGV